MDLEKKDYPEPIEALIVILVSFGIIFGAAIIITAVAVLLNKESVLSGNTTVMLIFGGLFFLILPLIYAHLRNYNLRQVFRLNAVPADILWCSLPLGLSLSILTDELDRIIRIFIPPPDFFIDYLETMRAETMSDWALLLFGVVMIAAVSEEMIFRGFLQISLEKKGDINRAVILSSITWTLIHVNPYWAIQIFITGVILGFLAWRTDSAYPSMIVHAANNFLALLFINMDIESGFSWYLWGDHVSPLILVLSGAVLYFCIRYITARYQ